MESIKTIIVEDIQDIRHYIEAALQKEKDIEVIGQAGSGREAVKLVSKLQPDVVLMDIQMENSTAGLEAAEIICNNFPQVRIIIFTMHEDDQLIFRAYCSGVIDYILKTTPINEIAVSIRNAHQNKMMVRPNIAEKIISEFTKLRNQQKSTVFTYNVLSKLSNSEFDVLALIFEGYKYKQIADMRYVSMGTIKSQINSILRKFECKRMKEVLSLLEEMNFKEIIANNN